METRTQAKKRNVGNAKQGKLTPKMKSIVDSYAKFSIKSGRFLSRDDVGQIGFNRDQIRQFFGSFEFFKEVVLTQYPNIEDSIIEVQIRKSSEECSFKKSTKGFKRFVITSAVSGSGVHKGFLKSIRQYCAKNKAKLIIIPCGKTADDMAPELVNEVWAFNKHYLNSNIYISDIKPIPKAVNPLVGLSRVGQRNGSTIVGSPKQFLEFVAVGDNKMPHAVMSTGSVTVSNYYSAKGEKQKVDIMASHDHVVGAIIVEIEDDKIYHFRQVQAETCGAFIDLGRRYDGKKIKRVKAEALYIGDYHVGSTDPLAAKVWDEVGLYVGVNARIHGDFFDGQAINHHTEQDDIVRAQLMESGLLSLEPELRLCAKTLDEETKKCDKVLILASNHHDFLNKHYLPRGVYRRDPQNLAFASKLISPMIKGKDPVRYAIEKLIGLKNPEKVMWVERDQSFKVAGIELGAHGDKGANGSKGSPNTLEKAYGNCVVGHSHSPKIIRGFWQVGTSTYLRLPYTIGSSSWVQSSCLVYGNGSRQMINCIGGKWKI